MTETQIDQPPEQSKRQKPKPGLPSDQCPFLFSWSQFGLYLGCTGETVRARHKRGDFGNLNIYRPIGWNGIIVVKAEIAAALGEIVGRVQRRTQAKKDSDLQPTG